MVAMQQLPGAEHYAVGAIAWEQASPVQRGQCENQAQLPCVHMTTLSLHLAATKAGEIPHPLSPEQLVPQEPCSGAERAQENCAGWIRSPALKARMLE